MHETKRVRWGVISTADIGVNKVLPAMKQAELVELYAIASRNLEKAEAAAKQLGMPKAYGSYEELLADDSIQAVYIPLPNNMHVEWIRKSIEAGKHVLCEKPLVMKADEIDELDELQKKSGLLIGEAFMVLHQPRWKAAKDMAQSGALGEVRAVQGFFSYYNTNEQDIRNNPEYGGGGLYDIGCYTIVFSRYIFGEEPVRVTGTMEYDPDFSIDRLTSTILEFPGGKQAVFTVSTQLVPHQRVEVFGTQKKIELRWPFNTPNDRDTQILSHGEDILEPDTVESVFSTMDHYGLEGTAFSRSILEGVPFAGSLENARGNARVIDAVMKAAREKRWVEL